MTLSLVIAFALGGVGWTLTEYLLHRWGAHEGPNKLEFRKEHLTHHARANYFAPASKKLWAASKALVPMGLVSALALGPLGVAFTAGFALTYGWYELLHIRIHTHAPRGPYSKLVRKHHYVHHFMDAKSNHGVTSPVWDIVFGTRRVVPGPVRVPIKLAPLWLFDADGEVRSAFTSDYERRGRRARVNRSSDEGSAQADASQSPSLSSPAPPPSAEGARA